MNKIPTNWHLCDGTNGTPDLTGRFLEGVTDGVGQFHSAGLPNITGEFGNCEEDGSPGDNGPFSRYSTYIGAASDLSVEILKRSIFYYELDGTPESGYTLKRIPAFNVSPHGAMGYGLYPV